MIIHISVLRPILHLLTVITPILFTQIRFRVFAVDLFTKPTWFTAPLALNTLYLKFLDFPCPGLQIVCPPTIFITLATSLKSTFWTICPVQFSSSTTIVQIFHLVSTPKLLQFFQTLFLYPYAASFDNFLPIIYNLLATVIPGTRNFPDLPAFLTSRESFFIKYSISYTTL